MRVGFLNNQIDNRGTGNAIFDYAHYNEAFLGNESVIFTLDTHLRDRHMEQRLIDRFKRIWSLSSGTCATQPPDVLYHIKSGADDGFRTPKSVRYAVHAVFECPGHGDRRATVSHWLAGLCGAPCVPHIVSLPDVSDNYREALAIREDAVVFGRYGGSDTFDIAWVWEALSRVLESRRDVYFVFANTAGIPTEILSHAQVRNLPQIGDPIEKRKFINTADAMIHARWRGETFGIAVGEFASQGKPVIAYGDSPEKAHLLELPHAEKYYNREDLVDILLHFKPYRIDGYLEYTPEKVMNTFREVFLD